MDDLLCAGLPAARGSASLVFDALREDIVELRLKPGTVLSRAALQDRFGLSSTPVRDALMRLQEEALVSVFPQHATIVAPIDVARAREGQFLRRSLEVEAVRVLAQAGDAAPIATLRGLIRQQQAFAALAEHAAFAATDLAFHRALFTGAEVEALWHVARRHSGQMDRLRRLHLPEAGKMGDIIADHSAIVDAIEAGRVDAAEAALRRHLSHSLDFIDTLRARHPDYFRNAARAE